MSHAETPTCPTDGAALYEYVGDPDSTFALGFDCRVCKRTYFPGDPRIWTELRLLPAVERPNAWLPLMWCQACDGPRPSVEDQDGRTCLKCEHRTDYTDRRHA